MCDQRVVIVGSSAFDFGLTTQQTPTADLKRKSQIAPLAKPPKRPVSALRTKEGATMASVSFNCSVCLTGPWWSLWGALVLLPWRSVVILELRPVSLGFRFPPLWYAMPLCERNLLPSVTPSGRIALFLVTVNAVVLELQNVKRHNRCSSITKGIL